MIYKVTIDNNGDIISAPEAAEVIACVENDMCWVAWEQDGNDDVYYFPLVTITEGVICFAESIDDMESYSILCSSEGWQTIGFGGGDE